MKKIRIIASAALLTLTAFGATTLTSCTKDCEIGYEGSDCKTLSRTKFIGDWKGADACNSGNYNITLKVSPSSTNEISALVTNAGGFGTSVIITGTVTSTNTISFTNQDVTGGRSLSGTMTANGNSLSFSYTVTPSVGVTDACTGTYTKL
ncbi:hypothetical protein DBR32_07360 [Taibaiella sp. KBW10]|uniref:hypothetical protein n=1 Tax=Taibaiella sp. KBW10 TaxID=2153357 RepID=UPI000F5AF4C3|nr:hypothetical protein [Taibaiella sp. KBW10]RQO31754.1 hypothetical protein DBR32_07360 [Taibaiella sp. KBW10]